MVPPPVVPPPPPSTSSDMDAGSAARGARRRQRVRQFVRQADHHDVGAAAAEALSALQGQVRLQKIGAKAMGVVYLRSLTLLLAAGEERGASRRREARAEEQTRRLR